MQDKNGSHELSIRAFAKTINVNESAVRKAIRENRFVIGWNADTKKIDSIEAEKDAWVIDQKVIRPKAGVGTKKTIEKLEIPIVKEKEKALDLTSILKRQQQVNLSLMELKLAEAEGKLIDKESAERVMYTYGHQLKKALEAIPSKIIDNVLAASSKIKAMQIMENEIKETLLAFSNGVDLDNIAD